MTEHIYRKIRIYVSSSSGGVSAEKAVLAKDVFPRLCQWCSEQGIQLYPIDLRYGLTAGNVVSHSMSNINLQEIDQCEVFLSIVSNKYEQSIVEVDSQSAVEKEIRRAVLDRLNVHKNVKLERQGCSHAIFLLRDDDFTNQVPEEKRIEYLDGRIDIELGGAKRFEQNKHAKMKLNTLRREILEAAKVDASEVTISAHNYHPHYIGGDFVLPDQFGETIYQFLLSSLKSIRWKETSKSPYSILPGQLPANHLEQAYNLENFLHNSYLQTHLECFTSHGIESASVVLENLESYLLSTERTGPFLLESTTMGMGCTSIISQAVKYFRNGCCEKKSEKSIITAVHFTRASSRSKNMNVALRHLTRQLHEAILLNDGSIQTDSNAPTIDEEALNDFRLAIGSALATTDGNVCIFLDDICDLERFDSSRIPWLPAHYEDVWGVGDKGQRLRYVLSISRTAPNYSVIKECLNTKMKRIACHDMPYLTIDDTRKITQAHLQRCSIAYDDTVLERLSKKDDASVPLYVVVAIEEMLHFKHSLSLDINTFSDAIGHIPGTLEELFLTILERLEHSHGADLVRKSLLLIMESRNGMFENEICDILGVPFSRWLPFRYSAGVIIRTIQTHKFDHLITIRSHKVKAIIQDRYTAMHDNSARVKLHKAIIDYFLPEVTTSGDRDENNSIVPVPREAYIPGWSFTSPKSKRGLWVLPFHLLQAGMMEDLVMFTSNIRFIEAKCSAHYTRDVVQDLHFAMHGLTVHSTGNNRTKSAWKKRIEYYVRFIQSNRAKLLKYPHHVYQCARNMPSGSIGSDDGKVFAGDQTKVKIPFALQERRTCFECINKRGVEDPCLAVLMSHTGKIHQLSCQVKLHAANSNDPGTLSEEHIRFASASSDRTIRIWNPRGDAVMTLEGHLDEVSSIAFHPKGENILVSCSFDGTVRVWNLLDAMEIFRSSSTYEDGADLAQEAEKFTCVSWHKDGNIIATGCVSGSIYCWQYKQGLYLMRKFKAHVNAVTSVFLVDRILVTTSYSSSPFGCGCYKCWDHKGRIILSRVGDLLSCTSLDRRNGSENWECACLVRHNSMRISLLALPVISNDNPASHNEYSREITLSELHGCDITSAALFKPFATRGLIALGTCNGTVKFFCAVTGRRRYLVSGHTGNVSSLEILPHGEMVVSGCGGGVIRAWKGRTQTVKSNIQEEESATLASPVISLAYASHFVDFVPFNLLFSTSENGTIEILNGETGESLSKIQPDLVVNARLCPDGRHIIVASNMLQAYTVQPHFGDWSSPIDVQTNAPVKVWSLGGFIHGGYILLVESERVLQVRAIRNGSILASKKFDFPILFCAMSPCGIYAACMLSSRKIILWDILSTIQSHGKNEKLETISAPGGAGAVPKYLNFSPSGDFLLVYGDAPAFGLLLRLHEVTQVATAQTGAGTINHHAWTPDGRYLAISGSLGSIMIYRAGKIPEKVAMINSSDHDMATHTQLFFSPTLDLRLFALSGKCELQSWRTEDPDASSWESERLVLENVFFLDQPASKIAVSQTGQSVSTGDIFGKINAFKLSHTTTIPLVTPFWGCRLRDPAKLENLVVKCPGCGRVQVVLSTLNALISEMQITRRKQNSMYALRKLDWHYTDPRLKIRCSSCTILYAMTPFIFDIPHVSTYVRMNGDLTFNCEHSVATRVIEPLKKGSQTQVFGVVHSNPFEKDIAKTSSTINKANLMSRSEISPRIRMQKSLSLPILLQSGQERSSPPVKKSQTGEARKRRPLPVVTKFNGQDLRTDCHVRTSLTANTKGAVRFY